MERVSPSSGSQGPEEGQHIERQEGSLQGRSRVTLGGGDPRAGKVAGPPQLLGGGQVLF